MPAELAAFLDAGEPPVVFTLGSSAVSAAGNFYEESAAAIGDIGCRAVLLVGRHPENIPTALPPNVIAIDSAPHDQLFPRASAIVHQCGGEIVVLESSIGAVSSGSIVLNNNSLGDTILRFQHQ